MALDFASAGRVDLVVTVARYVDIRRMGSEYRGPCPFHDDGKNPSFTIYKGSDGTMRYRCFACGAGSEGGDVIDFICAIESCSKAEAINRLIGGELPPVGNPVQRDVPPDEEECWEPIVPVPHDAPAYNPAETYNPRRGKAVCYRPTRIDTYRNANGAVLCHVVRLVFDDGKKICPTITFCVGPDRVYRWCAKRMRPPYPLLGLDALAARPGAQVLLVEGEKVQDAAASRLSAVGFVPVSWLGGCEAVDAVDIGPLLGRDIVYWPDADDAGRRAMARLHERIVVANKQLAPDSTEA